MANRFTNGHCYNAQMAMVRTRVWPFYLLSVLSLGGIASSYNNSSAARLRSPQGKVEFTFVPSSDMTVDPDLEKPNAGLRSIHYAVTFFKSGSRTLIQETDFYDNQISKN